MQQSVLHEKFFKKWKTTLPLVHSITCCAFTPVWFYPKSLTFKSWVMIVGKNIHSKINKDNCSSYQTQIMALSPVGRVQQKPPSPTSALQSISLSDCCCCHLSLPSVWLLQLSCWLVFVHALLPICQMSVKNLSSNQPALLYVCQSLFLPQPPAHPATLLLSLLLLPFIVRPFPLSWSDILKVEMAPDFKSVIRSLLAILPSVYASVWTSPRTNSINDQGS